MVSNLAKIERVEFISYGEAQHVNECIILIAHRLIYLCETVCCENNKTNQTWVLNSTEQK